MGYKEMYYRLFNTVTDSTHNLQVAQQEAEEMYSSAPRPDARILNPEGEEKNGNQ